jgi:hypothetical protein
MSSKLAANTPRLSTRDLHRAVVEAAQNPLGGRDICCKQPRARASHQADHVDQDRRDFDAFYVDCDHDDRHADEPETDADRMHDAIGDDLSAIVIPADLPRTYVG